MLYFRCRRCANFNKSKPVDGCTYVVTVHVQGDELKYPHGKEHHPSCQPELNGKLKALGIHRKLKKEVRQGQDTPFDAYVKAVHDAKQDGDAFDFIGNWASMDASYNKHYSKFQASSDLLAHDKSRVDDTVDLGHGRQEDESQSA
ncbi:hypothetical protein AAVH_41651 [Aphelenchoides avenae]|nr:hypothetical protein AAVH_41651 [Aphelenchus avenae]